jgi:hypothetical protein
MLRVLISAALLLGLAGPGQDMPVTKLSGGPAQAPPSAQPRRGDQLPPLPVSRIDPADVTLDSPRRLTLTFAEPRPIDEVLALLTTGTPFSIAIDADASGAFRGELKQLTLREALSTVLGPLGLDFRVQGTVIRVRRRQTETRLFDLNLLNAQRGLSRSAGTAGAALSTGVPPDDVMGSVVEGVKSLLSGGGTVHVDARAGLLQVTDFADRLDRVALYVETLHERSGRQVRLQAQAYEVTLRDASAIDWRAVRDRLGLPRDAPEAGIAADPAALRAALAAQGDVRVLWAPDVTVINSEPALLRIATQGSTSLTMTIVPQISADGFVQMSVSHAWETPASEGHDRSSRTTPGSRVMETDTVMRVADGRSAVIAGLLRPVPPASAKERGGLAELVVLVRPTVVAALATGAGGR